MSMNEKIETQAAPAKKPYTTPCLTTYGPIEKLTQSGSQATGDASKMMMACL